MNWLSLSDLSFFVPLILLLSLFSFLFSKSFSLLSHYYVGWSFTISKYLGKQKGLCFSIQVKQ